MNEPLFVLFTVAMVVVAIAMWYANYLAENRRREEMAALADELGWRFDPHKDRNHHRRYGGLQVFDRGHSRAAYNTIIGRIDTKDRPFAVRMGDFTYSEQRGTGKHRRTQRYQLSYILVHLPYDGVPYLLIRPERVADKFLDLVGFDDIDFESTEFNRSFTVRSSDKRFAYDVLHPQMLEYFMSSHPRDLELAGGCLCLSAGSHRWRPSLFKARLDWLRTFFSLWPDYLYDDLEERTGKRSAG